MAQEWLREHAHVPIHHPGYKTASYFEKRGGFEFRCNLCKTGWMPKQSVLNHCNSNRHKANHADLLRIVRPEAVVHLNTNTFNVSAAAVDIPPPPPPVATVSSHTTNHTTTSPLTTVSAAVQAAPMVVPHPPAVPPPDTTMSSYDNDTLASQIERQVNSNVRKRGLDPDAESTYGEQHDDDSGGNHDGPLVSDSRTAAPAQDG